MTHYNKKPFRIKIFFLFTLLYSLICFGRQANDMRDPGDWVGNGASFSENLVYFAFENLEYYLSVCMNDQTCTAEVQNLSQSHPETNSIPKFLNTLYYSIHEEKLLNPKLLRFAPQSSLFIIDGAIKVAVTGLHKGDLIYINKDMLYDLQTNDRQKPISLLQVVSILIHEFGHHLGIKDHSLLDQIGAMIGNQIRFDSQFINYHPRIQFLGAQLISPQIKAIENSRLALIDSEKYLDLSPIIRKIAQCPKEISSSIIPSHILLWNVHWLNPLSLKSKLVSYLALKCLDNKGELFDWIGDKFIAEPSIETTEHGHHFLTHNLNVYIAPCNRINGECESILYKFQQTKNNTNTNTNN